MLTSLQEHPETMPQLPAGVRTAPARLVHPGQRIEGRVEAGMPVHTLAGTAYGKGRDRLNEKLLAEVNNCVRCFRDMKWDLASGFDATLAARGYKPKA